MIRAFFKGLKTIRIVYSPNLVFNTLLFTSKGTSLIWFLFLKINR